MKLLFAGTPQVAVPVLQALLASSHEVVGVLTRADAPSRRGNKLIPSPVKLAALEAGLPVITGHPKEQTTLKSIAELGAQACAVVAYGHILRADALELVPQGWFNLHFSLLPAYRGAAPVQRALIAGDTESGVTVFQIDAGMDTGAIVAQLPVPIHDDDDAGTLLDRLAEIGAKVLVDSFGNLEHGSAQLTPQVGEVSLAPKIERSESQLNWAQPASKLTNLVRGLTPNPGAFTTVAGNRLGILPFATPAAHVAVPTLLPGEIFATKKEVLVGTGTSAVQLGLVQPPGKKPMPAIDWMRGARLSEGTRLQ